MLSFGRELYTLSIEVNRDPQSNQMLEDAFSLLAYSEPWKSPVGWQLDPQQREPVCAALNSAILRKTNTFKWKFKNTILDTVSSRFFIQKIE
jgi:Ran-binding protein 9/10